MFPDHSPSGRTRALTAAVFCVIIKFDLVSDSSALASLLNSPMMTRDVRLLHQPITIAITSETTAITTQYLLLPKYFFTAITRHFTSASSPRTRQPTHEGLRSQKMFSLRILWLNNNPKCLLVTEEIYVGTILATSILVFGVKDTLTVFQQSLMHSSYNGVHCSQLIHRSPTFGLILAVHDSVAEVTEHPSHFSFALIFKALLWLLIIPGGDVNPANSLEILPPSLSPSLGLPLGGRAAPQLSRFPAKAKSSQNPSPQRRGA